MNVATLLGRLVKDPELKHTASGTAVVSFTIAVDRRFKNANGEYKADFINCVAWKNTAEFIAKYFGKGQMIALCGSIQVRNWEDNEGNKRYATEVIVNEVNFAGEKKDVVSDNSTPSFAEYPPIDANDDDLPF